MVDLGRCYEILAAAALQPITPEEPELSLAEIANTLSLEIKPINFSRDMRHGPVLGISKSQCLIHYRTGGAFLLDLNEFTDGQPLPRPGDTITVSARDGIVTTSLRVSEANLRADKAMEKSLPEYLKNTFARD
jgi:hypothetical protein